MAKTCSHPGCSNFVFSKKLCKYHWQKEFGKPLRKPEKRIPRISKSKVNKDEEYLQICEELDAEAKAKGEWVCFFCGKPLGKKCEHHHVAGKEGLSDNGIPLFLDKDGLVLSHRSCHREYHDMLIEDLLKSLFYKALMEKIYYICKSKYHNMKAKHAEYSKI